MRRREVIAALGSAAAVWPVVARGQTSDPIKMVARLSTASEDDRELQVVESAFPQELQKLGWTVGRNVWIEHRWSGGDIERLRTQANDIVGKRPHVILVNSTTATAILKQRTGTIPIVFVNVADPVASGFVTSFARPGSNITGFTSLEYSLGGKWLSILKEIAPATARIMVLFNPANSNWTGYLPTIEAGAHSLGLTVSAFRVAGVLEVEQAIDAFAREPRGGMIVLPSPIGVPRELTASLAARHRLPAIYPYDYHAVSGGLVSYGSDTRDTLRRAASYVDQILKGAKPGDLPVQAPVKFELVINLKAAKAIDLDVPNSLRLLADRVIE